MIGVKCVCHGRSPWCASPATRNGGYPHEDIAILHGFLARRKGSVDRENKSAKFWLAPDVLLAENYGHSRKELRDIERIARENLERLRDEWDAFCGGHPGPV
jgi:hypothetical protein